MRIDYADADRCTSVISKEQESCLTQDLLVDSDRRISEEEKRAISFTSSEFLMSNEEDHYSSAIQYRLAQPAQRYCCVEEEIGAASQACHDGQVQESYSAQSDIQVAQERHKKANEAEVHLAQRSESSYSGYPS